MVDQFVSRPTVPNSGEEPAPRSPDAPEAAAAAPGDEPVPIHEHAAAAGYGPIPAPAADGGLPLRRIIAAGGMLLLIAGAVGWLFARSRRRPTRRERATDAVRGTAMAAAAMAGSLGGVAALRGRLGDAMPSRKDVERRARQASKAARRAREALPR